ncbi:MAG: hypothetical protein CO119_10225 [Flavobacteriales bacterium CG_4_9_14_3_um_filter_40_17]|nr:MAG: hypothetical protein CO119_10225 [Flavobacteriales bacterium CG_4_9_14_3_um_filter_40_17]
MPFVTTEAMAFMLQQRKEAEITLPKINGKLEPLFGVYSKKCVSLWKRLIDENCIKLQDISTHFDLKIIEVTNNSLFSEKLFQNLNTQDEFKNALKTL